MDVLTGERNHRSIVGLLAIVAVLMHIWVVGLLMRPSDIDKTIVQVKVVEVALVTQKPPEKESAPPQATPPKKVEPPKPPPKKKEIKPLVKKPAPILPKVGDIAAPKTVTKEKVTAPPVLTNPFAKTETSAKTAPVAPAKPAAKSGAGDSPNKGVNSGVALLVKVPPAYPARAMSRHIEGWVKIEFTVSASGAVTNPSVVGASPSGIFEEAALSNILKWKFKPKMVNGNPVPQRVTQVVNFKLVK